MNCRGHGPHIASQEGKTGPQNWMICDSRCELSRLEPVSEHTRRATAEPLCAAKSPTGTHADSSRSSVVLREPIESVIPQVAVRAHGFVDFDARDAADHFGVVSHRDNIAFRSDSHA